MMRTKKYNKVTAATNYHSRDLTFLCTVKFLILSTFLDICLVVGNPDIYYFYLIKSYSFEFLLKKKTVTGDYYNTHADLCYSALQARHNYYCYSTTLHTTTQNTTQCIECKFSFKLLSIYHLSMK